MEGKLWVFKRNEGMQEFSATIFQGNLLHPSAKTLDGTEYVAQLS